MKITRKNLKRLIESYLAEGTLSKSEKDLIRTQVEVELGEEFELLASQAKSLEDYDRMEKIFPPGGALRGEDSAASQRGHGNSCFCLFSTGPLYSMRKTWSSGTVADPAPRESELSGYAIREIRPMK